MLRLPLSTLLRWPESTPAFRARSVCDHPRRFILFLSSSIVTTGSMPLAEAIVKTTIEPTATDESGKLFAMAQRTAGEHTAPLYQRLEQVMRLLGKTWPELYRDTGLGQDYISKLKSGRLGKERPQKLQMEMFRVYGVPFDVWSSERLDWRPSASHHPSGVMTDAPAQAMGVGSSLEGGPPRMAKMVGPQVFPVTPVDLRRELARMAAELDEPKEVILEILSVEPPRDADQDWWFRQYVEIVRKARKPASRR